MKSILRLLFVFLAAHISMACHAGNNDEVTLIVTSDGASKDEAVKNALRTAIEQTYGVFVSTNTEILNDDLVKDEIATLSSGNIKKFTELAYSKEGSRHIISLNVIVSRGKLLSYAKSRGAICELDGASMYADMQLQEMYKQNEEMLFQNLCSEVEQLLRNGYDYKLDIKKGGDYTGYSGSSYGYFNFEEPNKVCFDCRIFVKLNEQGEFAWKKLMDALKNTCKSPSKKLSIFPSLNPSDYEESDDGFPYQVDIPKCTVAYDGYSLPCETFKVRSSNTANIIYSLVQKIPDIVTDISLKYGEIETNISGSLMYLKEDHSDGTLVRLNMLRPYSKKKGNNCGEYRYFLNVDIESLKSINQITITPNNK